MALSRIYLMVFMLCLSNRDDFKMMKIPKGHLHHVTNMIILYFFKIVVFKFYLTIILIALKTSKVQLGNDVIFGDTTSYLLETNDN